MRLEKRGNNLVAVVAAMGLLPATPAIAGMPALAGLTAKADTAETSITNPAGMSRLGERATTLRAAVAKGMGEFEVDEGRTTVGSSFSPAARAGLIGLPTEDVPIQSVDRPNVGSTFTRLGVPEALGMLLRYRDRTNQFAHGHTSGLELIDPGLAVGVG